MERGALFLVNPAAGGGRTDARLRRLLSRDSGAPNRHEVAEIRSVAEAAAALRGLPSGIVPVAVGGDGTVGMVVAGLGSCGAADTAIAILPLGTGNILARTLGIADAATGMGAIFAGPRRRIDVLRTSHASMPVALISVSAGFEGRFMGSYGRRRRYGRGWAVLASLPGAWSEVTGTALELDGERMLSADEPAFSAGLYNSRCYAAGVVMSPDGDPSDGVAESAVYRTGRDYLRTFAAGLWGGITSARDRVLRRPWRVAQLTSTSELQIDGESVAAGSVRVWVDPGALSVRVPA